jgi:hypothetical protein
LGGKPVFSFYIWDFLLALFVAIIVPEALIPYDWDTGLFLIFSPVGWYLCCTFKHCAAFIWYKFTTRNLKDAIQETFGAFYESDLGTILIVSGEILSTVALCFLAVVIYVATPCIVSLWSKIRKIKIDIALWLGGDDLYAAVNNCSHCANQHNDSDCKVRSLFCPQLPAANQHNDSDQKVNLFLPRPSSNYTPIEYSGHRLWNNYEPSTIDNITPYNAQASYRDQSSKARQPNIWQPYPCFY